MALERMTEHPAAVAYRARVVADTGMWQEQTLKSDGSVYVRTSRPYCDHTGHKYWAEVALTRARVKHKGTARDWLRSSKRKWHFAQELLAGASVVQTIIAANKVRELWTEYALTAYEKFEKETRS